MSKDQKAPEEPRFDIRYNRSLSGAGRDVRLCDLGALVREAHYRGFSDEAVVSVLPRASYDDNLHITISATGESVDATQERG